MWSKRYLAARRALCLAQSLPQTYTFSSRIQLSLMSMDGIAWMYACVQTMGLMKSFVIATSKMQRNQALPIKMTIFFIFPTFNPSSSGHQPTMLESDPNSIHDADLSEVRQIEDSDDLSSLSSDKADSKPQQSDETTSQIYVTAQGERHIRAMDARKWVEVAAPRLLDPFHYSYSYIVQDGVANTRKFQPDISDIRVKDRSGSRDLVLRLWRVDTLVAADKLRARYADEKIAVLNMANPHVPGGGLLNGSRAQEEALCMRTTLYQSLSRSFYPLKIPDVIFSPNTVVCKGFDESWTGFDLTDQAKWFVNVISAAAPAHPALSVDPRTDRPSYTDTAERQAMVDGVQSILQAAVQEEMHALVLGAWGCGMFKNPINEVAVIMREAIIGTEYGPPDHNWAGLGLEEIVIAIYDTDHEHGYPVWHSFLEEFRILDPFPQEMQYFSTPEVCHIFRWPETDGEDDSGVPTTPPSVGNPPREGKSDDAGMSTTPPSVGNPPRDGRADDAGMLTTPPSVGNPPQDDKSDGDSIFGDSDDDDDDNDDEQSKAESNDSSLSKLTRQAAELLFAIGQNRHVNHGQAQEDHQVFFGPPWRQEGPFFGERPEMMGRSHNYESGHATRSHSSSLQDYESFTD